MLKYVRIYLIFLALPLLKIYGQDTQKIKAYAPEIREKFIQKAANFRKNENYNAAINEVDSILAKNPKDAQMLLFKGDLLLQSKRFSDATLVYQKILPLGYERTISQINLSYAEFSNHKTKHALKDARKAWKENDTNVNATVNYFNAQLWNIQVNEAAAFLDSHKTRLSPAQILVLKARLYTTSGNFKKGLEYYAKLVKQFPDKYYVQEYAEVLLGKKEWQMSREIMAANQSKFTKSEYAEYLEKYRALRVQLIGTEFVFFKDGGNDIRISNSVFWQERDGHPYRWGFRAGLTEYSSPNGQLFGKRFNTTNSEFLHGEVQERWNLAWSGKSEADLQNINSQENPKFTGLTWKQTVQYQPHDRRMVGLYISSNYIDWTANILARQIKVTTFGYLTHILVTGHTGIFSQGGIGFLKDSVHNMNYQFFGSIYHLFRTEPTLKFGLNFTVVHYKNPNDVQLSNVVTSNTSLNYAPNLYEGVELFGDYSTALANSSKYYLKLQGGLGIQKQDSPKWLGDYRALIEVGTHLKYWDYFLRYQTSNASALPSQVGYKFYWFTTGLIYKW